MISFAKVSFGWLNEFMKNYVSHKDKFETQKPNEEGRSKEIKITDVNILLNRVRLNKKTESRKKIYFSTATALGLFLFGIVIF